jgi:ribose-phosphate pyrophosphokinase
MQNAAQALIESGAERVWACAVHGLFSGPAIQRIEQSAIEKFIVTNTIPLSAEKASCKKLVTLSVARLLGQAIRSIHEETSVSSLFV